MVKVDNKPVLVIENMYEVLCRTHAEIDQHAGQKQLWKSIKERWGWLKQDLIEKFINNCTICALRKPSFHPLAAKPIIARNFLSRIQVINFFYLNFYSMKSSINKTNSILTDRFN